MTRAALAALACAWLAAGAVLPPQDGSDRVEHQSRRVMGTLCEIQVYHSDADAAQRAMTAALDEMSRVDRLLSNYLPDSELSRMNGSAGKAPFHASAELYAFVKRSRGYFDETRGTFDPTMGSIVRAWGFFTSQPQRPPAADAAAAKATAGFDKVTLDDRARTIAFAADGLEIDPGGIGKGYAVDRAVSVLRERGITSALVSAGGSTLFAIGRPPGRDGWKVAVRDPANPAASLGFVMLRETAVSTSGVSEKFVVENGHRYAHIVDPRTGEPSERMCQVTLVAPDATGSDAYTKGAFLLSRDDLVALFGTRRDVHILRVEDTCTGGVVWTTPWSTGVFRR
jgi:thiamine biosynthesis lipoprotein